MLDVLHKLGFGRYGIESCGVGRSVLIENSMSMDQRVLLNIISKIIEAKIW